MKIWKRETFYEVENINGLEEKVTKQENSKEDHTTTLTHCGCGVVHFTLNTPRAPSGERAEKGVNTEKSSFKTEKRSFKGSFAPCKKS